MSGTSQLDSIDLFKEALLPATAFQNEIKKDDVLLWTKGQSGLDEGAGSFWPCLDIGRRVFGW